MDRSILKNPRYCAHGFYETKIYDPICRQDDPKKLTSAVSTLWREDHGEDDCDDNSGQCEEGFKDRNTGDRVQISWRTIWHSEPSNK